MSLSLSKHCFKNKCAYICCNNPIVLKEEKKKIIKYTRMGILKRWKIFKKHGAHYIINGTPCPFLKNGKCSIEPVKPLNCRIYPLIIIFKGNRPEWALDKECPAVPYLTKSFIEEAKMKGESLMKAAKNGQL